MNLPDDEKPADMRLPEKRGSDPQGSGHFGAPRGLRVHKGQDFKAIPGVAVHALLPGTVTKLGYPYPDKMSFRYVEVTDPDGRRCRYFYVQPSVEVGDTVKIGSVLGVCQRLPYEGITQHYHFEVMEDSAYLDPIEYLEERGYT